MSKFSDFSNDLMALFDNARSDTCNECGRDSEQYADIGKGLWECEDCYERGIEDDVL